MNIHFAADTHFGHKNIIHHANRPFADVEEMDEGLISVWNAKVGPRDEVWFLGDFSFHKAPQTETIFSRLNGTKHLVVGNHDGKATTSLPWSSQSQMKRLNVNGERFELCHFPLEVWDAAHHGAFHLHGHSHGTLQRVMPRRMDVGVDLQPDCSPFSIDEILDRLSVENFTPEDHHGS